MVLLSHQISESEKLFCQRLSPASAACARRPRKLSPGDGSAGGSAAVSVLRRSGTPASRERGGLLVSVMGLEWMVSVKVED